MSRYAESVRADKSVRVDDAQAVTVLKAAPIHANSVAPFSPFALTLAFPKLSFSYERRTAPGNSNGYAEPRGGCVRRSIAGAVL